MPKHESSSRAAVSRRAGRSTSISASLRTAGAPRRPRLSRTSSSTCNTAASSPVNRLWPSASPSRRTMSSASNAWSARPRPPWVAERQRGFLGARKQGVDRRGTRRRHPLRFRTIRFRRRFRGRHAGPACHGRERRNAAATNPAEEGSDRRQRGRDRRATEGRRLGHQYGEAGADRDLTIRLCLRHRHHDRRSPAIACPRVHQAVCRPAAGVSTNTVRHDRIGPCLFAPAATG